MKTKKELRKIALKAWRMRRENQTPDYFEVQTPAEVKEKIKGAGKKLIMHIAALKAWETRRKNKKIAFRTDNFAGPVGSTNELEIEKHGVECAKLLDNMTGVRAFATVFQVGKQVWRLKISRLKKMPPSKPVC